MTPASTRTSSTSWKNIHDGTFRLHEVMDSMFDIAQIDARSLKPNIQPMELGHLITGRFVLNSLIP